MAKPHDLLHKARVVFWDFDGVIKDSHLAKGEAFAELFSNYGNDLKEKIREHHIQNGGISRYDKIWLYLNWVGIQPTHELVEENALIFSELVVDQVVSCKWIPGAREYLMTNKYNQIFEVVSATPFHELSKILAILKIDMCFARVYGHPTDKIKALQQSISDLKISPSECIFIGDAQSDQYAASISRIPFLLMAHKYNIELQYYSRDMTINGFGDEQA